jgi:hypothetical protein
MLWIAALAGVAAATVLVVLVSHTGNRDRVTPLREGKTSAKPRGERRSESGLETGSLIAPGIRPRPAGRPEEGRADDRTGGSRRPQGGSAANGRVRKHEGIRPVQSTSPKEHGRRAVQPPAIAIPVAIAPSGSSAPAAPAEHTPSQRGGDQPAPPQTATPAEDQVEIEIRDGELKTATDRIRSHGRHLTLRVRSDQFVIVEVEDSELSWPVLADKDTLITLDTHPKKHFEIELTRRGGVLVLRLDD